MGLAGDHVLVGRRLVEQALREDLMGGGGEGAGDLGVRSNRSAGAGSSAASAASTAAAIEGKSSAKTRSHSSSTTTTTRSRGMGGAPTRTSACPRFATTFIGCCLANGTCNRNEHLSTTTIYGRSPLKST